MATQRRVAPPPCDYELDGTTCGQVGDHTCIPRGDHVVKFFSEILCHTKGRWARRAFKPSHWQEHDVLRPLFSAVTYDAAAQCYVRRYRIAWIELARKQGKSELLAGVALYLLVADGEEGAEIYGCARDIAQARKVFDVALRMVRLSPLLSRRITPKEHAKRLVDEESGSYYEVVAADAAGNLGHNPSGIVFDEVITQPNGDLWNAMRTGMGTRDQPLLIAATTAGDDPQSFAKAQHDEMMRIAEDPARAPHVFVYIRNMPQDADPFDEANWYLPNPALGDFLSVQSLRDEAIEAKNDPSKENAWRQFRCNQWVSQVSRWMPLHLYDACTTSLWLTPDYGREQLLGRPCFGGFDLAAKSDLCAWCLIFQPEEDDHALDVMWRFWLPEAGLEKLDKLNDGKFSKWGDAGWITVTPGNILDYDRVIADMAQDAVDFTVLGADCDEWSFWPIINRVAQAIGLDPDAGEIAAYRNTFERMAPGVDDVMAMVTSGRFDHHGNPVARFCFDACEVRRASVDPNLLRPNKPDRKTSRARIDAVATAVMAANAMRAHAAGPDRVSAYESHGLMVV